MPGDEACDRSVTHLHVARTSGSDLPGAGLGRCNGHLSKTYPALRQCLGDRRPNPWRTRQA